MDKKKIINIYLIIITVITVCAMILGVTRIVKNSAPLFSLGKSSEVSEDTKLEAFDKISLDLSVCEVNLKIGTDYHISYQLAGAAASEFTPTVNVADDTLTVVQKKAKNSSFFKSLNSCIITITVPSNANLTEIKIGTDVGDINIDDIICKNCTIDSHVGDIDINNAKAESLIIKADVGDIDVKDGKCDIVSVTSNVGDVKIKDIVCNAVSADSNIGDVTVDNVLDESGNKPQMDINLDIGSKKIDD